MGHVRSFNWAFLTLWILFETITMLEAAIVNGTQLVTITTSTQWKKRLSIAYVNTNHLPTTTALRDESPDIVTSPSGARVAFSVKKSQANYNFSSNSNVFLSEQSDFENLITRTPEASKNTQLSASIPTGGNGTVKMEKLSGTLATSSSSIISTKLRNMEIYGSNVGGGISIVQSKIEVEKGGMSVYPKSSSIVMKNATFAKIPSRSFSVLKSSMAINSLNRTFEKGDILAKTVIDSTVQTTPLPQAKTKISGRSGITLTPSVPEIIVSSRVLVTTTAVSPLFTTTVVPQLAAITDVPLLDTKKLISSLVTTTAVSPLFTTTAVPQLAAITDIPLPDTKNPISSLVTSTAVSPLFTTTAVPQSAAITDIPLLDTKKTISSLVTSTAVSPLFKTTTVPKLAAITDVPLLDTKNPISSLVTTTVTITVNNLVVAETPTSPMITTPVPLVKATHVSTLIATSASLLVATATYSSSFNATHTADLEMYARLKSSSLFSNHSLPRSTDITQYIPEIIHSKVTVKEIPVSLPVTTTSLSLSSDAKHTADLGMDTRLRSFSMMKQTVSSNRSLPRSTNMTQYTQRIVHSKVTVKEMPISPLVETTWASLLVPTTTYSSDFNATRTTDLGVHAHLKSSDFIKQSISFNHSLSSVTSMTQYIPGIIHSKVTVKEIPVSLLAKTTSASPLFTTTTYSSPFNATRTADLGVHARLKSSNHSSISFNHSLSSVTNMTQYIPGMVYSKETVKGLPVSPLVKTTSASPLFSTTTYFSSFNSTDTLDLGMYSILKSSSMMKQSIPSDHSLPSTNMTQYIQGIVYSKTTIKDLPVSPLAKTTSASPLFSTTTYSSSFNATHTVDMGMYSILKSSSMMKQSISSDHSLPRSTNMTQYIHGIVYSKTTVKDLPVSLLVKTTSVSPLIATRTYSSSINTTHTADLGIHARLKSSGMMKQSISSYHSLSSVTNTTEYVQEIIDSKVTVKEIPVSLLVNTSSASPLFSTTTYSLSFNATHTSDLGMHARLKSSRMVKQSISSNQSLSSVINMTQSIPGIVYSKITVKEIPVSALTKSISGSPLVTTTTYSSSFNATHTVDLGMYTRLKSSSMMKQSISSNHSLLRVTNMTQHTPRIIQSKVTAKEIPVSLLVQTTSASPLIATRTYSSSINTTHTADLGIHARLKSSGMMKQSISSYHSLSSVTNMTGHVQGIIHSKVTVKEIPVSLLVNTTSASPLFSTTTYSSSFNATHTVDLGMYSILKSSSMMKQSISSDHSMPRSTNMTQYIKGIVYSKTTVKEIPVSSLVKSTSGSPLVTTTIYSSSFNATHTEDLGIHARLKSSSMMKQSISSNHSLSSVTNMTQHTPRIIQSKVTAKEIPVSLLVKTTSAYPLVTTTTYSSSFNATHTVDLGMYSILKSSSMMKQSISSNHSLPRSTNMTQYIPGIVYSKVTVKEIPGSPLAKTTSASPLVTTMGYLLSSNATHTANMGMSARQKSSNMRKQSISSNNSMPIRTNMTQYIQGIIHSKITNKNITAFSLDATTFSSPLVAKTSIYSIMLKQSMSLSHSLPSSSNMTTPGNRTVNRVDVQKTLSKPTLTLSQFADNITISTSSPTSMNIMITLPVKKEDIDIKYTTASSTAEVRDDGKNFTLSHKGAPGLGKTFSVTSSSIYYNTVKGKITSIKSAMHKEGVSRPTASGSSILPSRNTISFHHKTINSSIISATIESKMNISFPAIVSTFIASSTGKEIRYSTMVQFDSTKTYKTISPSSSSIVVNTEPNNIIEQEFHITFKIISEEFTNALLRQSSKEFQEKSREIEQIFDRAYKYLSGYTYSRVRRFFKGSIGCDVSVFVESKDSSPISKEEIEEPLLKANKSTVFGKYVIGNIEVDQVKPNEKEGKKSWGRWPVIVISILGGVSIVLLVIVITQCIQKRYYTLSFAGSTNIPDYSPQIQLKRTDERSEDDERIPMTTFYPSNDNP